VALSCATCRAPICISKITLFRNLSLQQQLLIIDNVTRKEFSKGEVFINEKQTLSQFVIVNDGRFKAYTTSREGKQNVLYFFLTGDFFGQHSLFEDIEIPYTVEAMEDSSICMIESDVLKNLMIQHPEMSLSIVSALSSRVSYLEQELSSVHLENVEERLLGLLYDLSKDYGVVKESSISMHLPLSQQEMAMRLGVSRESVSRNFRKLISTQRITMHTKKEVILPIV
jgi:CRP-like cAMP-binding protein